MLLINIYKSKYVYVCVRGLTKVPICAIAGYALCLLAFF